MKMAYPYWEKEWRQLGIGDAIRLVADEFDGKTVLDAVVTEISKDHALAKTDDGIVLWLDDFTDQSVTLTLYKLAF